MKTVEVRLERSVSFLDPTFSCCSRFLVWVFLFDIVYSQTAFALSEHEALAGRYWRGQAAHEVSRCSEKESLLESLDVVSTHADLFDFERQEASWLVQHPSRHTVATLTPYSLSFFSATRCSPRVPTTVGVRNSTSLMTCSLLSSLGCSSLANGLTGRWVKDWGRRGADLYDRLLLWIYLRCIGTTLSSSGLSYWRTSLQTNSLSYSFAPWTG